MKTILCKCGAAALWPPHYWNVIKGIQHGAENCVNTTPLALDAADEERALEAAVVEAAMAMTGIDPHDESQGDLHMNFRKACDALRAFRKRKAPKGGGDK